VQGLAKACLGLAKVLPVPAPQTLPELWLPVMVMWLVLPFETASFLLEQVQVELVALAVRSSASSLPHMPTTSLDNAGNAQLTHYLPHLVVLSEDCK